MSINYTTDNTIIFTIARMNPPTPGHLFLIKQLIEKGLELNVNTVYVILSKGNEDSENPIPCPEKIEMLGENSTVLDSMVNKLKENMKNENIGNTIIVGKIDAINVVSICVPDLPRATPFSVVGNLIWSKIDAGIKDINLFIIIGDDRVSMIDSIADFYYFKNENVKSIDSDILPREDMETFKGLSREKMAVLDINSVPVGAFSASFVRKLVKHGLKDKFDRIYSPYLSQGKIASLYSLVQSGLNLPENRKKDPPPKPLKYVYPIIKDLELGKNRKFDNNNSEYYNDEESVNKEYVSKRARTIPIGGKKSKLKKQSTRLKQSTRRKQSTTRKQSSRRKQSSNGTISR